MIIAGGNNQTTHESNIYIREKHHRNNRSLQKFYDARYLDVRDKTIKTGKELSSGRDRRTLEINYNNQRPFRANKYKPGSFSIRRNHYQCQPHDLLRIGNKHYECKTTMSRGKSVQVYLEDKTKSFSPNKYSIQIIHHANSWILQTISSNPCF